MTNAAAVPFHTGPELSRAINRTDFFRLFKAAAQHYHFDNFALARISEANAPFGEREIVITNIAERRVPLFVRMLKEALGALKAKTAQFLTTPVYGKTRIRSGPTSYSTNSMAIPFCSFLSSRRRGGATASCSAAYGLSPIREKLPTLCSMPCVFSTNFTRKS